jgi:hypothetical protein
MEHADPVDVSRPIRAVIPTLDGPVLQALAGTSRPLTGLDVHRLAGVGSSQGVRRVLGRLAREGIVHDDHRGNAIYYVANREHLAWPAIDILAGLRVALRSRLAEEIGDWPIPAIHASMFGSAARGDGDAASDIDVLLVEPDIDVGQDAAWQAQVDALREQVRALTGNRCHAFVVTRDRLADYVAASDPLIDAWLVDGVHLVGTTLADLLTRPPRDSQRRRNAGRGR